MKTIKLFLLTTLIFCGITSFAAVNITKSEGWMETAYVEWSPVDGATSYNVYYKHVTSSANFIKIDGMLIRKYADYFRADAVGLRAGSYNLKVVPVIGETEDNENATISETITVKAHRREGFAFSQKSTHKTSSGAYNDDGTLKSNAQVIYLTASTAQSVTMNVITNNKGAITQCTGIGNILAARQKGYDKTPLAIRIVGTVNRNNMGTAINGSGFVQVKGNSEYTELNTTIEGIGEDATVYGWGILIRQCINIEVRNLGFMMFPEDGVSIDTKNHNIWVHNNDFFYGENKGGDKNKGDGSLDSKTSGWITISYNHFWDSGKCNLLGNGTEVPEYHTYHHNWYDHSDSRHPRVRWHTVHVYNNYFDGNSKYGIGATCESNIFVENNYFRNCKRPMTISKQGSDLAGGGTGTFSGENGGMIKAFGNILEGTSASTFNQSANLNTDFDAIVVNSRNETVPATYKTKAGETTYSNFDTHADMYTYNVQTAADARNEVMAYAGRTNGGDFKFTFNDSEDTNSEIIAALENALKNYKSSVLQIGFGSTDNPGDPSDPGEGGGDDEEIPEGAMTHNFTTQDKISSYFVITGNLSTSKGAANYAGMVLTQCLKIESSTNITFTTDEEATLTLVLNNGEVGVIKVNGVDKSPVNGVLTMTIPAGENSIKKGGSGERNLYYISVVYNSAGLSTTENNQLLLYPNPVTDKLYISSSSPVKSIAIIDALGKTITQQSNKNEINTSNLPSGIYIVKVKTEDGETAERMIKIKN
jgi:Pectate lyase